MITFPDEAVIGLIGSEYFFTAIGQKSQFAYIDWRPAFLLSRYEFGQCTLVRGVLTLVTTFSSYLSISGFVKDPETKLQLLRLMSLKILFTGIAENIDEEYSVDLYDIDGLIRSFKMRLKSDLTTKSFLSAVGNRLHTTIDDFNVFSKKGDFLRPNALLRNGILLDEGQKHIHVWLERSSSEIGLKRRIDVKGNLKVDEKLINAHQEVNTNAEDFSCSICYDDVKKHEGIVLINCHHLICRECVDGAANGSEFALVQCPVSEGEVQCSAHISPMELRFACRRDCALSVMS
ncbi:hypothetical protein ACOME3_006204 [Neoechinorhynchus agilis]